MILAFALTINYMQQVFDRRLSLYLVCLRNEDARD
jgi:hypothetical protein